LRRVKPSGYPDREAGGLFLIHAAGSGDRSLRRKNCTSTSAKKPALWDSGGMDRASTGLHRLSWTLADSQSSIRQNVFLAIT